MSGRLQASGAGDRSSVLISPATLKMLTVMLSGHLRPAREPLGVGPALQHRLRVRAAGVGLRLDVVEGVEHQQRLLQRLGGDGADGGIVEQVDQRRDVVAAEHGAQQFGRLLAADQRAGLGAMRDRREVACLDLGSVIDAGRHALRDHLDKRGFLARRRLLQQLDQFGRLGSRKGQRRNAERGAFGDMGSVGLQHGGPERFVVGGRGGVVSSGGWCLRGARPTTEFAGQIGETPGASS